MSNNAFEAINARIRTLRIEQEQISASYDAQIKGLAESLDILDRHLQSTTVATATDSPFTPLPTPAPKKRRGRRTKAEMEAAAAAAAASKADGASKPPAEDYADI